MESPFQTSFECLLFAHSRFSCFLFCLSTRRNFSLTATHPLNRNTGDIPSFVGSWQPTPTPRYPIQQYNETGCCVYLVFRTLRAIGHAHCAFGVTCPAPGLRGFFSDTPDVSSTSRVINTHLFLQSVMRDTLASLFCFDRGSNVFLSASFEHIAGYI